MPLNGASPINISYAIIPKLHQTDMNPEIGTPATASGGKNSGVVRRVFNFSFGYISLAKEKSVIET